MRNQGTGAEQWVGLVYNFQDPQNYYEVVFSPTGVAQLRQTLAGVTWPGPTVSYSGGGTGIWFDVAIHRDENLFRTSIDVNGVPVFVDLPQSEYTDGLTGLITHGTTGRFDKVSLSILLGQRPFKKTFGASFEPGPDFFPQSGEWSRANGTYNNAAVEATSYTQLPIDIGPQRIQAVLGDICRPAACYLGAQRTVGRDRRHAQ